MKLLQYEYDKDRNDEGINDSGLDEDEAKHHGTVDLRGSLRLTRHALRTLGDSHTHGDSTCGTR